MEAPHDLAPLFERADAEVLWFFSPYQRLWFSPDELRRHHANGKFRWSAVNWQLRNPQERLDELGRAIDEAIEAKERFAARLSGLSGESSHE